MAATDSHTPEAKSLRSSRVPECPERSGGCIEGRGGREPQAPILIIGYGNPGRGDDAAGWLAAEAIEKHWADRVEVMTLHQLDVVLAERFVSCDIVVFVDAEATEESTGRALTRLYPNNDLCDVTHCPDPAGVLGLAKTLYAAEPEAYLVTVCATQFNFGEPPSPETARDIERAVGEIDELLQTYS